MNNYIIKNLYGISTMATSAAQNSDYNAYKKLDTSLTRLGREFSEFFIDRRHPNDPAITGYHYLFFTSPDLSLTSNKFQGSSNSSILHKLNSNFLKLPGSGDSIYTEDMVNMLSGEKSVFMNLFTNRAAGVPGSDEILDTMDYSETWNKYKIPIATTTKDSRIAGTFEIPFYEDQNLTIMKTVKLWMDYMDGLFLGHIVSGNATTSTMGDTQDAIIDYMSSMYHFAVRPDGRTLIYWGKYTGVFPTKNPFGLFQTEDSTIKLVEPVPITFAFAYKEDMEIAILRDFNLVTQGGSNGSLRDYTGKYYAENSVNIPDINVFPCIKKVTQDISGKTYQLRFAETSAPESENGYREN